jgi:hypothetical protein
MKKPLLAVLMAGALSAADVTGRWKGTLTPEGGNEGPALVILKQMGESVTGSGGPDESERHEIINGKVAGDKVTFEIATGGQMKFDLTIQGDELSGQVTRERQGQFQTAKLSLKREK